MMFSYLGSVQQVLPRIERPDGANMLELYIFAAMFGFALTTDVVVELWCTCREISEGIKFTKRELTVRFGMAVIRKVVPVVCIILSLMLLDVVFHFENNSLQVSNGEISGKRTMTHFYQDLLKYVGY